MLFVFFTNLISFLKKEQLKVISISEYDDVFDEFQFDVDDFMFAVQIDQEDFILRPTFNITMSQKQSENYIRQYQRNPDGSLDKTSTNIEMIPCTNQRFTEIFTRNNIDFSQQFQQLKVSNFLCPVKNSIISIGGTSTSSFFHFVELSVAQCQNKSQSQWSPICSSEDKKILLQQSTGLKIKILSVNQMINPFKPKETYIQPFIDDSLVFSFNSGQKKAASIYLTKYEFKNDESLLPISMIEDSKFFVIDSKDVQEEVVDISSDVYITCQLRKKPFKIQFQRQYQKLDELLSNIGGILQIVTFFTGLLVTIYNRISCMIFTLLDMVELANKVFEFSQDNQEQVKIYQENLRILQDQDKYQKKQSESKQCGQSNQIIMTENDQQIIENIIQSSQLEMSKDKQNDCLAHKLNCANGLDYFQTQLKKMFEKKQPISLSFQIFLNYISCDKLFKSVPKVKLMNKAYEQIISISDIYNVLTKLNEIDKLKEVMLTPKQLVMFNFTPKPLITLENDELKIDRNLVEKQTKQPHEHNEFELLVYAQMMLKNSRKNKHNNSSHKQQKRVSFMPQSINNYVYQQIYNAYDEIFQQKNDHDTLNSQLITKLGPEMESIYQVSKMIDQGGKHPKRKHVKIASSINYNQLLVQEDLEKQENN